MTPTSVEITVDVPTRLLVTISGSAVSADHSNIYALSCNAQLFDISGTILLGRSQGSTVVVGEYLTAMSDSEALFDASVSQPYTQAAGSYKLALNLETPGSCSGVGVCVGSPALTYVLLSSAFDRIFANGFAFEGASRRQRHADALRLVRGGAHCRRCRSGRRDDGRRMTATAARSGARHGPTA